MNNSLFFPHDNKSEHFKPLDGLRAIAVLLVFLAHLSNNGINLLPFLDFNSLGQTGVYLFFIMSSYLLDRQIAIAIMSGNSNWKYWLNYFLRRFLRIFPLFIFALLLYTLIFSYGYKYCICLRKEHILPHLLLQEGRGPFWSIPVEFRYYFLSPLIILGYRFVLKWNFKLILFCTLLFIIGITVYNDLYRPSRLSTIKYLPVFLFGSLLSIGELLYKDEFKILQKNYGKLIDILATCFFLIVLLLGGRYFFDSIIGNNYHSIFAFFRKHFVVQALLLTFIIFAAKYGHGFWKALLSVKFLRFIGVISFSFYLFHYPLIKLAEDIEFPIFNSALKFYFAFSLSVIFSTITFLVIERPLSKIKIFKKTLREEMIKRKEKQAE